MQDFCYDQKETQCLICFENLNQPYQIISCQHEFCIICLKGYLEQNIDEKKIDEFKCPLCQKCIEEEQILAIIDQIHKDRYNEYKNEKFKFQQQRRDMIKFYLQNKKLLSLCRCPWCEQIFYRAENGCNYIRCQSLECQGKNTFCAQCDTQLTDSDHDQHYENNNPFKGKCRILRDGVWVDRSTIFK